MAAGRGAAGWQSVDHSRRRFFMSWLSALLGSDDGREQPLAEVEREGIASLRRSMQELLADLSIRDAQLQVRCRYAA